jgi:hypothetical protein
LNYREKINLSASLVNNPGYIASGITKLTTPWSRVWWFALTSSIRTLCDPAGRQAGDDEGLAARVGPVPGRVIHGHMNVPDARRHIENCRAEHLHDPQVFGPVLQHKQKPRRESG